MTDNAIVTLRKLYKRFPAGKGTFTALKDINLTFGKSGAERFRKNHAFEYHRLSGHSLGRNGHRSGEKDQRSFSKRSRSITERGNRFYFPDL